MRLFIPIFILSLLLIMSTCDRGEQMDSELSNLVLSLKSPDDKVRHSALLKIALFEDRAVSAMDDVIECTNDNNPRIRSAAIIALIGIGQSKPKKVVPILIDALSDNDFGVRGHAVSGIGDHFVSEAFEAIPKIKELLKDDCSGNRGLAAEALGNFGNAAKSALPDIRKLLNDEDAYVREKAQKAIEKIEVD